MSERSEQERSEPQQQRQPQERPSPPDSEGREQRAGAEEKPSRGYRIPGRDLAGASYGANEREQTADHTLENESFRMDDGRLIGDAGQTHPRDDS